MTNTRQCRTSTGVQKQREMYERWDGDVLNFVVGVEKLNIAIDMSLVTCVGNGGVIKALDVLLFDVRHGEYGFRRSR